MVVILDTLETVWRLKKTKKDIGYRKIFDLYFHLKIDCFKQICYNSNAIFLQLKVVQFPFVISANSFLNFSMFSQIFSLTESLKAF